MVAFPASFSTLSFVEYGRSSGLVTSFEASPAMTTFPAGVTTR